MRVLLSIVKQAEEGDGFERTAGGARLTSMLFVGLGWLRWVYLQDNGQLLFLSEVKIILETSILLIKCV